MKKLLFFIVLILSVSLTISAGLKITTGKNVTINATCIGAIDEATLDKVTKFANKGDEASMKAVVASGYAIIIQKGTKATVVKVSIGKVRVKLSDGKMVWVLYKHVS